MSQKNNACTDCTHCVFSGLCRDCLPDSSGSFFTPSPVSVVPLPKGKILYSENQPVRYLFALHRGFLKQYSNNRIAALLMPGQLVNGGDIFPGMHRSTVITATDTVICRLEYSALYPLSQITTQAFSHITRILTDAAYHQQRYAVVLRQPDAGRKIAALLMLMMTQLREGGMSETTLFLPLLHREIADLLGLTTVTLRRELNDMVQRGIIFKKRNAIEIINRQALFQSAPDVYF